VDLQINALEELREHDTLAIWRLDRFGRSLKDLVSEKKSARSGASNSRVAPRASTR
jgi:DNA invertase Pin-like site-specific DNA recombinase